MSEFVPIALLHFQLVVEATRTAAARLHATDRPVRTVFASYATDDRVDVLQWARGAEIAGVDVFLDVLKLRESSRWERDLFEHIPTKDLFCLFWSAAASRSHWVDREWRCALEARGLDYVHPVPLADPRDVPPPRELQEKHFGGPWLLIQQYGKKLREGASPA